MEEESFCAQCKRRIGSPRVRLRPIGIDRRYRRRELLRECRGQIGYMGTVWQLRSVEKELISDMLKTTLPFSQLAKKYGVTKQAISNFCHKKGIKRPKREHTENCTICQSLIRISKRPHSDFISSQTLKEKLRLEGQEWFYHIGILRKRGLISQRFGKVRSIRVERAYQIYFKKRLPVSTIGRQAGLKNFHVTIRDHKALGWEVPDPLFTYDGNERRKRSKMTKEKRRMQLRRAKSPGQREAGDSRNTACVEKDNCHERVLGGEE